ncbi:hypothetical protein GCM10027020_23330 [Nocardioides salsibiostraticola]
MAASLGGAVALATIGAASPGQAAANAEIYVVQGIPERSLDVEIDGELVEEDAATSSVLGPFDVEPGSRSLRVSDGDEVVLERTMDVAAASSSDVVVHLPNSATEPAQATVFENDLDSVPRGKSRLTVAHTAAVAPADIRVNGEVLFENVANGESLTLTVPEGSYTVDIVPTGQSGPAVFGPRDVAVKGGSLVRVYAVGDPTASTMDIAKHVLRTGSFGSKAPDEVNTGTGGQAVGHTPVVAWTLWR